MIDPRLRKLRTAFLLLTVGTPLTLIPYLDALGALVWIAGAAYMVWAWRALSSAGFQNSTLYGRTAKTLVLLFLAVVATIVLITASAFVVGLSYLLSNLAGNASNVNTVNLSQLEAYLVGKLAYPIAIGSGAVGLIVASAYYVNSKAVSTLGRDLKTEAFDRTSLLYQLAAILEATGGTVAAGFLILYPNQFVSDIPIIAHGSTILSLGSGASGWVFTGALLSLLTLTIATVGSYAGYAGLGNIVPVVPEVQASAGVITQSTSNMVSNRAAVNFCVFCGARLSPGASFCHVCGKPVFKTSG